MAKGLPGGMTTAVNQICETVLFCSDIDIDKQITKLVSKYNRKNYRLVTFQITAFQGLVPYLSTMKASQALAIFEQVS
jgi:hypothetical protein